MHPALLHALHVSAMSHFLNDSSAQAAAKDSIGQEPEFLRSVSPESKKKYYAILSDKFSPKSTVQSRLDEWASQQSDAVKAAYAKFKSNAIEDVAKLTNKVEDTQYSAASKSAIRRINSLNAKNETSLGEGAELYSQIVESLAENERREVHDFFSNF
ncbi:hypothetical protein Tcan_13812 [Toxocara canis]|uniref:SXP/RAL-2 family protein Ani s 5-like cation-binding domain-containing protein n=2 Tax=Toxocara canis TaxID=6265 RepID=A0A0B2VPY1_TOXCA|nr:hypothetical protein Tcan_13812 [Toxocara canis]VDM49813.1 unnamed protein product [Toxocara canis]